MSRICSVFLPVCIAFCIALLSLCSCSQTTAEPLWSITTIPQGQLDSLHRIEQDVLIVEGHKQKQLELFLRHNNRTEQMQIPLVWELRKHREVMHRDTIELRLAERKGEWIGQELVTHEITTRVEPRVYVERAGLYTLVFYTPAGIDVEGLSTLGFRLR